MNVPLQLRWDVDGTFEIFAAANLVGGDFRIFDWPNLNIDPHFNVVFDADFAAGDTDSDPSYNLHHYIAVLYSTDGGENYLPGLVFRYDGRGGARTPCPLAQVLSIASLTAFL